MQLLALRLKFVELSGRYDLKNANDSDNGADFFLNSAQRYLDRRLAHMKTEGRFFKALTVNDISLNLKFLRAPTSVWVIHPTTQVRSELELVDLQTLRQEYDTPADIDAGVPLYYALNVIGLSSEQEDLTQNEVDAFDDSADIMIDAHYDYDGILFYPKADLAYDMVIYGKFYTTPLSGDTDVSFWTTHYEDLVLDVALAELEGTYRNESGMRGWREKAEIKIVGVEKDIVEKETFDIAMYMQG